MPEIYEIVDSRTGEVIDKQVQAESTQHVVDMIRKNQARYGRGVQIRARGPGTVEHAPEGDIFTSLDPQTAQPIGSELLGTDAIRDLSSEQLELLNATPEIERSLQSSGFIGPAGRLNLGAELPFWASYDQNRSPALGDRLSKLQGLGYKVTVVPDPIRGTPRIIGKDPNGNTILIDNPYSSKDTLADFTPQPEELIGGAAGAFIPLPGSTAVLARGPSRLLQLGYRGLVRASLPAAGEAAGTVARIGGTENIRDIFSQEDTQSLGAGDILGESAETFGLGFAGEAVGNALSVVIHPFKRYRQAFSRNLITMGEFEKRALRAQEEGLDLFKDGRRLKLPELSAAYANPLMRVQLSQASRVSTLTKREMDGTVEGAFNALIASVNAIPDLDGMPMEVIHDIRKRHERAIQTKLRDGTILKGREDAFSAIRDGLVRYQRIAATETGSLYEEAKMLAGKEQPVFDVTHAANIAQTEMMGITFPKTDFSEKVLPTGTALKESERYEIFFGPLGSASIKDGKTGKVAVYLGNGTLQTGTPMPKAAVEAMRRARSFQTSVPEATLPTSPGNHATVKEPKLAHLLSEIASHSRDARGITRTQDMDLIRAWRTDAYNLAQEGKVGVINPEDYRTAVRIHQALTNTLENPIGARGATIEKLMAANNSNRVMEEVTNSAFVRALLTTDASPRDLGRQAITPDNVQVLNNLRASLGEEGYKDVRAGYVLRLLESPETIDRELTLGNPEGLRALMDETTETALRNYSQEWRRFQSGAIVNLAQTGYADTAELLTKLSRGETGDIIDFVEGIGGKDSPRGRSLQAAFLGEMLEAGRVDTAGNRIGIDPRLVVKQFREWRARGVLDHVFESDQLDMLEDVNAYLSLLPAEFDVGSSLVVAGLASSTKPGGAILHPLRFAGGVLDSMGYYLTGRAMLSKEMRKIWKAGNMVDAEAMYEDGRKLSGFVSIIAATRGQAEADAKLSQNKADSRFIPQVHLRLKDERWEPIDYNAQQLLQMSIDRGVDPRQGLLDQFKQ